jgi:phage terminase large subunit-like protein
MPASRDHVTPAIEFAKRLADDASACETARKSAAKFNRELADARAGNSAWAFDDALANRAMLFASNLPNIKGPEADKPIRLMDWQRFVYANLFGFVEAGTRLRRFRQAYVAVPRGNGKTTVVAPAALYCTFMEREGGAEGYAAAVTRDQARILFDMAQQMVRRTARLQRPPLSVKVMVNAIFQEHTASRFAPISSDAKALDGLNVAVAVCDEIASHKTPEVYDVLLTAMGKRTQPLLICITTATDNSAGVGKQLWDYSLRVLDGIQDDDRLFSLIYTADTSDDTWDEVTWRKVNPGWGQTVQPDAIRAIAKQARNNAAQESVFKTRHLNLWVGADEALFSMRAWNDCRDPTLRIEDYFGKPCHMALDLASKTDIAAIALVFRDGERYAVFSRCYLNEAAVSEARNPSYPQWARDGVLRITPGNETDFGEIETDLIEDCRRFDVQSVAYDPWGSTQLAQRLAAEGVPVVEFRANTQNFSEPTKELDAAIRAGRLRHDGNGALSWCMSNVVGHYDARGNVYPRKARPENKIDAAVALIMATARAIGAVDTASVYESRGLLVLG